LIYGYARISSEKGQKLDSQIEILKNYGVDKIISETITGIAEERELIPLIESLQKNDKLVVTNITRLGRKASQLLVLLDEIEKRQAELIIVDLGVSTKGKMGRFFVQMAAAFAELERETLKERQRIGIEIAKKKNLYKGRIKTYTDKHKGLQHAFELYKAKTHTVKEICEITKISRATLYRYIKVKQKKI
jgi:DNA invertase Pin-like site-specific DNA recombinase